ncbi:MAG TPA: hypothetical protein VMM36_02140 [Opitutaceae bacterium]|nr:hypothetical protein [Opitutaceae bacterium]
MSKSARIALLITLMILAVLFAPLYMGHLLGGITAAFIAIGVVAFLLVGAAGAIVLTAAGILTAFIAVCVIMLVALSPVLVPVALLAGFIWLIVKMASRRPAPPAAPPPPAAPEPVA